jgi:dimethylhistidine N-methyltransferase
MRALDLLDLAPATGSFLEDALAGLSRPRKSLPCKYLYDERGSRLFERICELPEYYPTRTELSILAAHIQEMADRVGERAVVVEYGSGAGTKTLILLRALRRPVAYVPIDISREALLAACHRLQADFPGLTIRPVCADYTTDLRLPVDDLAYRRIVAYFPGSTIGNFTPDEATVFLRAIRKACGTGGGLLIGVDLVKDRRILEQAYDDRAGVTAAFNLNLIRRLQTELAATCRPSDFQHLAFWNEAEGRIEMHLVSRRSQRFRLGDRQIALAAGETVHTESSYKYTPERFAALAAAAGLRVQSVWTDPRSLFSIQYLAVAPAS